MSPLMHKLGLGLLLAGGVVLVTLAVITFSPLFGAVALALCCALVGWAGRPMDPGVARTLLATPRETAPTLITLREETDVPDDVERFDR